MERLYYQPSTPSHLIKSDRMVGCQLFDIILIVVAIAVKVIYSVWFSIFNKRLCKLHWVLHSGEILIFHIVSMRLFASLFAPLFASNFSDRILYQYFGQCRSHRELNLWVINCYCNMFIMNILSSQSSDLTNQRYWFTQSIY